MADIELSDSSDLVFIVDQSDLEGGEDDLTLTHQITINNGGSGTESVNLSLSVSDSDYVVNLVDSSDANFSLTSGEERVIDLSINVDISDGLDSGVYQNVLTLITQSTTGTTDFDFDSNISSMIELDNIYFYVNDRSSSNMDVEDVEDGDEDLTVTPGDEVTLYFNLDNLFDSSYNYGDLDIEVELSLDDDDFGEDVDEGTDFILEAGENINEDDQDYFINFEIPTYALEGNDYILSIILTAEDGNGAEYIINWDAQVEVEREDDDIRIDSVSISPSEIDCGEILTVVVDVTNYGSNDQDDSVIEIESADLDIFVDTDFSLDYGHVEDDNNEVIRFEVTASDEIDPGTYEMTVNAYYDYNTFSDRETEEVIIESCNVEEVEEVTETVEDDDAVEEETISTINEISSNTISTVEKKYSFEDITVALTLVLITLIVTSSMLLLLVVFRRTRR